MGVRSVQGVIWAAAFSWLVFGVFGATASANAAEPGQVLWTFFETLPSVPVPVPIGVGAPFFNGSNGDNILRLVNSNGAANTNLPGARGQTVCAMIYVFDSRQEMGECCGCPVSSAGLATFSVAHNLIANWTLAGLSDSSRGAVAIVAATPNAALTCLGQSGACNGGCDPTNLPGYSVTTANNLLGSMTHNQFQAEIAGTEVQETVDVTEAELFDDSAGDPNNVIYLQDQCGAVVGNGSGAGICSCPTE